MTLSTLLNAVVSFTPLTQGYEIGLNWLGRIVRAIIEGIGIVGVGIIVFTLVLKAITLPFDIYQRVKMRKQNLIMRNMQPELEKLQKQYANDKNMYQQKMLELYKKNGYSMLGACLPMIISLVILIVAFSAFRLYSQYANLNMYVQMSDVYNAAVLENSADGIDFTLQKNDDGTVYTDANGQYVLVWTNENGQQSKTIVWENGAKVDLGDNVTYTLYEKEGGRKFVTVTEEDKYLQYEYDLETSEVTRQYGIDTDKLYPLLTDEQKEAIQNAPNDDAWQEAYRSCVVKVGATAAAEWYRDNDAGFLWIKNVWYPDVSYNHPIAEYKSFKNQFNKTKVTFEDGTVSELQQVFSETQYNNLTSELTAEKDQANGYFILIILSIGLMVLSQVVTMKSQKESNKYQSVDGQGAATQKMMLIMMPLIYAVFAFMYSAAFSIYMTMSSVIAILVTVFSNLIIGRIFRKKEDEALREKYTRTVPWKSADESGNKKANKKNK